jgi:hypothetical protein
MPLAFSPSFCTCPTVAGGGDPPAFVSEAAHHCARCSTPFYASNPIGHSLVFEMQTLFIIHAADVRDGAGDGHESDREWGRGWPRIGAARAPIRRQSHSGRPRRSSAADGNGELIVARAIFSAS